MCEGSLLWDLFYWLKTSRAQRHFCAGTLKTAQMDTGLQYSERRQRPLSFAAQNKVDLFILDIQLLDYRGTELARQLRALPEYRFTPILFTTELAGGGAVCLQGN